MIEEKLPTYEQWTKDMSLADQIKFYFDVDIDNYLGDPWEILAECAVDPHWLEEFKVNFKLFKPMWINCTFCEYFQGSPK